MHFNSVRNSLAVVQQLRRTEALDGWSVVLPALEVRSQPRGTREKSRVEMIDSHNVSNWRLLYNTHNGNDGIGW